MPAPRHARPSRYRPAAAVTAVALGAAAVAVPLAASATPAAPRAPVEPANGDSHVLRLAFARVPAGARPSLPATVTARPGDTLSAIAARACGNPGDYWALAYNNGLADPDRIFAGQVFRIACQAAAGAVARRYGSPGSPPSSSPARYVSHGSGDGDGDSDDAGTAPVYRHPSGAVVTSVSGTFAGSGAMQRCIIARESGGNPRAVNPASGAGGLYQFLPSTWHALGYSGLPEDAPVWEQNQAFSKEVAQDGGYSAWTPYDGC